MKAHALPVPGIVLGGYPERRTDGADWLQRTWTQLRTARGARAYEPFLARVRALAPAARALGAADTEARLRGTRAAMARDGLTDTRIAEAFALVAAACARELGVELFTTQLLAARIMLDNRLAEMATGEGKTLAAGVCAATAALAGIPVHVVTANDYLVARDARTLEPVYRALGLSVAAVTQPLDPERRRRAYDCDIVYCTAGELVFDYLRDGFLREHARSDLEQRVARLAGRTPQRRLTLLRGLCMAIVDEADSVLIDDARVPLILSERRADEADRTFCEQALELAGRLVPGEHFVLNATRRHAELTPEGRARVAQAAENAPWRNRLHREETLCTALAALHLYERDRHYLVKDGAVMIIDESTGRVAPGRVWSRGLQRLVELKEGCAPSPATQPVAQITYQRFFRRYLALGGMSGTLHEARGELQSVYGLAVVRVPLARPNRRTVLPTRLHATREEQWDAAVAEAIEVSREGRPVLIGTDSVGESEAIAQRLAAAGAAHAVLNARQDHQEATIVAAAGEPGRITVATNMAGRGTDIALAPGVAERGGLHVVSCQHNASRRIDRQLIGRCARRGDPGSARALIALDKPLIARVVPRALARAIAGDGRSRPQWLVRLLTRFPQWLEESRGRAERRLLLERDRRTASKLAYGRPVE